MTATYCPACLDVVNADPARLARGDWVNIRPGIHLHVSCGRALEALRTAPPVIVAEDDDFPELPVGWAA